MNTNKNTDHYIYIPFYMAITAMLYIGGGLASLLVFLLWLLQILMVSVNLLGASVSATPDLIKTLTKKPSQIVPKRILRTLLILAMAYHEYVITAAMLVISWLICAICRLEINRKYADDSNGKKEAQ